MTRDKAEAAEASTPSSSLMSPGPGKGRERVKVSDARPSSQAVPAFSQPEVRSQPAKPAPPRKID